MSIETLKNLTIKQICLIIMIIVIVFGTIGIFFYKNVIMKSSYNYDELEEIDNQENMEEVEDIEEVEEKVIVHIAGCIKNQGIVILDQGQRIIDAIEKAGGATEEADLNKINLAYELQDGEKIYIPSKNDEDENNYITSTYSVEEKGNTIININKASIEQLQTLNGIGESMARKIIKYREENGKFEKIEDIKNVPGIGDSKFNNIKDNITVK